MKEKFIYITYRIMFVLAGIFFVIALLERILNEFNYTITWIRLYSFRILELSAIIALFVITLLLRQIRNILKQQ